MAIYITYTEPFDAMKKLLMQIWCSPIWNYWGLSFMQNTEEAKRQYADF